MRFWASGRGKRSETIRTCWRRRMHATPPARAHHAADDGAYGCCRPGRWQIGPRTQYLQRSQPTSTARRPDACGAAALALASPVHPTLALVRSLAVFRSCDVVALRCCDVAMLRYQATSFPRSPYAQQLSLHGWLVGRYPNAAVSCGCALPPTRGGLAALCVAPPSARHDRRRWTATAYRDIPVSRDCDTGRHAPPPCRRRLDVGSPQGLGGIFVIDIGPNTLIL